MKKSIIILLCISILLPQYVVKAQCQKTDNKVIHIKEQDYEFNLIIEEYIKGYISSYNAKVKEKPNKKSKTLDIYKINKKIKYTSYNDKWVKIKYKDSYGYIKKKKISNKKIKYTEYNLPNSSGFKSYMGYNFITNTSSPQYKLQKNYTYTGKYGIRQINNRYCVALGSYFDISIGQHFDIILKNNTRIPCILGDEKDDSDTDQNHLFTTANGCCTEFIVDLNYLKSSIKKNGNTSYANKRWKSPVKKIIVYNKFYC